LGEHWLLIAPDEPTAGRRMEKHDRGALPARIPVPKLATRNRRRAILGGSLRRDRGRGYRGGLCSPPAGGRPPCEAQHQGPQRGGELTLAYHRASSSQRSLDA